MVLPSAKGGPRVIEEIVLNIALPTISRAQPTTLGEYDDMMKPVVELTEIPGVPDAQAVPDETAPDEKTTQATADGEPGEPAKNISSDFSPRSRAASREPPPLRVIKIEELDLDAPPNFDDIKMSLINVPQSQVVIMDGESQSDKTSDKTEGDEKNAEQPSAGPAPQTVALPHGTQQIYTLDPQVLKRLQWRLARMEDFETSIGLAVAEIKEAIAKTETTRLELEDMRKGYATVEKTMHELAALYDLISASVNPFVDSEQEQATISTKIMKHTLGMDTTGTSAATVMPSVTFGPEPSKKKDEKQGDSYSVDTWTVKWAEFLLERTPKSKISALLDHYIEIGWLDEEIKARVEETIKGIDEINLGIHVTEDMNESEEEKKKLDWWKLPIDDHVKSLQFIEKIRGGKGGGFTPSDSGKK